MTLEDDGEFIFIYESKTAYPNRFISQPISEMNAYEALKKFRSMHDANKYEIIHVAKLKDDELQNSLKLSHAELCRPVYM